MSPPLSDSHIHHHGILRSHHQQLPELSKMGLTTPVTGNLYNHNHSEQNSNHALTNGVHNNHKAVGSSCGELFPLNSQNTTRTNRQSGGGGGVGSGNDHIHNSEFELSTDTDDDSSMAGEADSSNNLSPLDVAIDALKDTRPKDRERVLHVIKMLVNENVQWSIRNEKLLQELHSKEDEITDLLQYKARNDRNNINAVSITTNSNSISNRPFDTTANLNAIKSDTTTSTTITANDMPLTNGDISGSIPEITEIENRTITIGGKNETEVIRMPLKKSMRRSPEDSVVIMQAHKLRDECIDKSNKLNIVTRSGYIEREKINTTPPLSLSLSSSSLHNSVMVTTVDASETA